MKKVLIIVVYWITDSCEYDIQKFKSSKFPTFL